jgi:hypothetical protein
MMRRILDRLRTSRAGALYHRLDGTSEEDGRPWMTTFADERGDRDPDARSVSAVDVTEREVTGAGLVREPETEIGTAIDASAAAADPGLVPALNRVADAFERMAASIEVEHREREARLDAVEQLLRELVAGLAQPTAVPPVVVGGSISLDMLRDHDDGDDPAAPAEIDLADPQFELEGSDDESGDAV